LRPAKTGESRAQPAAHANLPKGLRYLVRLLEFRQHANRSIPGEPRDPANLVQPTRPSQISTANAGATTKIVTRNLPIYLPHRSLFNFEGLQTVARLFRLTFHNVAVLVQAEFNFKDPV